MTRFAFPSWPRRALAGLGLAATAALLAACAAKPTVHRQQDPEADLSAYRTFAFYPSPDGAYPSLLEQRLRQATRRRLEAQHYVYDERQPDLRVNYRLQVVQQPVLQSTPAPGRLGYRGWSSGVETVIVRQGTLVIDLVDARRNTLVWRGIAEGRLDAKAAEQPWPVVDAAVAELFMGYQATARREGGV